MDPDKRLFKYPNVVFLSAPIDSGSYPTTSLNSEADPGRISRTVPLDLPLELTEEYIIKAVFIYVQEH